MTSPIKPEPMPVPSEDRVTVVGRQVVSLEAGLTEVAARIAGLEAEDRAVQAEARALAQAALHGEPTALERRAVLRERHERLADDRELAATVATQLEGELTAARQRLARAKHQARRAEARALVQALADHQERHLGPGLRDAGRRYDQAYAAASAIAERYRDILGSLADPRQLVPDFLMQAHVRAVAPGLGRALEVRPSCVIPLAEHIAMLRSLIPDTPEEQ